MRHFTDQVLLGHWMNLGHVLSPRSCRLQ
jgi:hypothetical protein